MVKIELGLPIYIVVRSFATMDHSSEFRMDHSSEFRGEVESCEPFLDKWKAEERYNELKSWADLDLSHTLNIFTSSVQAVVFAK